MARYTTASKERVREAVDFLELVSAHTDLKRVGANRYMGLCPFHEEHTPSFSVDPTRKLYHCFGCGASGDPFTFLEATEQLDFKGAVEQLAQRYGVELELEGDDPYAKARRERRQRLYALLERAARFYRRLLESKEGEAARRYLERRGVGAEATQRFCLGYASERWDGLVRCARRAGFAEEELLGAGLALRGRDGTLYDRFRGRLIFPLWDERGRVVGFGARLLAGEGPKYVNSPEGELYHKGRLLYALHLAREGIAREGAAVVCEGYLDVIALHQAGIEHVVGAMGTALTGAQLQALGRLAKRVVVALDGDAAGRRAAARVATLPEAANLSLAVALLPAGPAGEPLDPAEVVARWGPAALKEALRGALPCQRFVVEQTLAQHDLRTAAGKEEALRALAPFLAPLPEGPLRRELVGVVSEAVELPLRVVAELLGQRGGTVGRKGRRLVGPLLSAQAKAERLLLALCLALPAEGQEVLRALEPKEHISDPTLRAVASYLQRADLSDPRQALAEAEAAVEGALRAVVAEGRFLAARAENGPGGLAALRSKLRAQRLQIELAAAQRALRLARQSGVGVLDRSRQVGALEAAFAEAQREAVEGPAPPAWL